VYVWQGSTQFLMAVSYLSMGLLFCSDGPVNAFLLLSGFVWAGMFEVFYGEISVRSMNLQNLSPYGFFFRAANSLIMIWKPYDLSQPIHHESNFWRPIMLKILES
jgi:hypothetical protein